jgi:hypothetical protein
MLLGIGSLQGRAKAPDLAITIDAHLTARANLSNRGTVTTYALESGAPRPSLRAAKGKN